MQYANGGDLQNYLKNNFNNLTWYNKKKLAIQIANGLNYLYNEDVLHRDFHSKNILIHNNNAKITEFGTSKIRNNSTTHIGPCEPEQRPTITEILEEFSKMSLINKPIKSKVIHFDELIDLEPLGEGGFGSIIKATRSKTNNYTVCKKLTNTSISQAGTPEIYEKLYKKCWKQEDQLLKKVLKKFLKMGFGKNIDVETTKKHTNNNSDPDSQVDDSIQFVTYDGLDVSSF
ncbi:706_t:CDS:2 [Funneliformis mosseae]|uniref:706_t:CDS:1 n=1 Tax=Funneliformis mosseae TaxID=27381 RepID=A0A9N9BKS7_FUNMO|nr:706_t:CDS:2 [Funneliformis mosseae]